MMKASNVLYLEKSNCYGQNITLVKLFCFHDNPYSFQASKN